MANTKKKILIIEDNIDDSDFLTMVLNKEGYNDIHVVERGKRGVEIAKVGQFDLIVIDTLLPDIDGFETCRRIRTLPEIKKRPVIIITTGVFEAIGLRESRRAGADSYAIKTRHCSKIIKEIKKFV